MSIGVVRKESGFLDTGLRIRRPRRPSPGPLRQLLGEAGEMLRGAIGAPLRHAQVAADHGLERLSPKLRKDIGLYV